MNRHVGLMVSRDERAVRTAKLGSGTRSYENDEFRTIALQDIIRFFR